MTSTTRALIAAARAGLDPDPATAARVRAKLGLALGGAAPMAAAPGAAPVVATPAAAGPVAAGGLALKLAAVIAVASAVATVAVVAVPSHRTQATTVPAPTVDDTALVEAPAVRVHTAAPEPAVVAPRPRVVTPIDPPQPAATPTPAIAPAAGEVSLSREVELIDRAMAALRAGHPDDALAAIAIYHRETRDRGQLTEDATAIDIEASCTLHLDVTAKLAAFDHLWPSSAERSRLTPACGK